MENYWNLLTGCWIVPKEDIHIWKALYAAMKSYDYYAIGFGIKKKGYEISLHTWTGINKDVLSYKTSNGDGYYHPFNFEMPKKMFKSIIEDFDTLGALPGEYYCFTMNGQEIEVLNNKYKINNIFKEEEELY